MDEQGNIFPSNDTGTTAMAEWEIRELLGVIASTARAGVKTLCKSGVLGVYGIRCIIRLSDRYNTEVCNLEAIIVLAFRAEPLEAAKVREVLLEKVIHTRKEKTTVFTPLFTGCISEKH